MSNEVKGSTIRRIKRAKRERREAYHRQQICGFILILVGIFGHMIDKELTNLLFSVVGLGAMSTSKIIKFIPENNDK